ncbi:MAG: glycosyltransferase [Oligoflexia bacterium]|nr:glycosyltransferase [Oligoflexia bacterium]
MISLIIPTIGTGPKNYFESTIKNATQTSSQVVNEILVIDNSHNDDFSIYAQNFINSFNDQRFNIVKTPEMLSMANNWNYALQQTSNPWHLYLHDDDLLNLDIFNNIQVSSLKDVGFISFDFDILNEGSLKRVHRSSGINGILQNTPKFVSTIFSTKYLNEIGGWKDEAGHALDLLAFVKLEKLYSSDHISQSLGQYRLHDENASSKKKRAKGYGNGLPYVISECFKVIEEPKERKELLFHLTSFTYPNDTFLKRSFNFIFRLFGFNAWFK